MTPQEHQAILKDSETLLDLFEHEGWSLFMSENQTKFDTLRDNLYLECNTNDLYQQRRGMLEVLHQTLTYETVIKSVHEELMEGDNGSQDL